jgi:phosphohistidine phosphatase
MRTLLLMRHAKSSWLSPELDDHERPLNNRGTRDAPRMAKHMAASGWLPGMVLCSDAVRTRATLALMLLEWPGRSPRIAYDPALYLAEPAAILESIARAPADVGTLLVLGHNPGMHALALALTGRGEAITAGELSTRFPTCALAVLEFAGRGWSKLAPGSGTLRGFVYPKQL